MNPDMNGSGMPGFDSSFGTQPRKNGARRFAAVILTLALLFMAFVSIKAYVELNAKPNKAGATEAAREIEKQGAANNQGGKSPKVEEKPEGSILAALWASIAGTPEATPSPTPTPTTGKKQGK